MRTWRDITKEMETLARFDDREWAHIEADRLLVEALRINTPDPVAALWVEKLIAAYENIEKWYA